MEEERPRTQHRRGSYNGRRVPAGGDALAEREKRDARPKSPVPHRASALRRKEDYKHVLRGDDEMAARRARQEAASGASGATAVGRKRAQGNFDKRTSPRGMEVSADATQPLLRWADVEDDADSEFAHVFAHEQGVSRSPSNACSSSSR